LNDFVSDDRKESSNLDAQITHNQGC
jgi:hypothetical protein